MRDGDGLAVSSTFTVVCTDDRTIRHMYMRPGASRYHTMQALYQIGVSAPVGLDTLTWYKANGLFTHAIITDHSGMPLVFIIRIHE